MGYTLEEMRQACGYWYYYRYGLEDMTSWWDKWQIYATIKKLSDFLPEEKIFNINIDKGIK